MKDLKKEIKTEKDLAVLFHNTYEKLAPSFGYETRKDTKQFDETTPNGKLMIAVSKVVLETIRFQERQRTLEEVRVKVGNKSAKVIGKLNNRQYDYGLGVVRCVGILSEVISKITKRGK